MIFVIPEGNLLLFLGHFVVIPEGNLLLFLD